MLPHLSRSHTCLALTPVNPSQAPLIHRTLNPGQLTSTRATLCRIASAKHSEIYQGNILLQQRDELTGEGSNQEKEVQVKSSGELTVGRVVLWVPLYSLESRW